MRLIDGDKLADFLMNDSVDCRERHEKTNTQKDYFEGKLFVNVDLVSRIHAGEFDAPKEK